MSKKSSTLKKTATSTAARSHKNPQGGGGMMLTNTQRTAAELTGEVAAMDFATVGWSNIEAKFLELRGLLSAPTSGLNASQARVQQKEAVSAAIQKLLDMAQGECRRLLVEGNAKAAVEGGLKTLELKKEYYGPGSLQLVPSYFHLARTNQYMDKFKRAEEFLSLAQYEILRHPEADVSLKAELHQTFGLLYASDGKLDAAIKHLTCATYYLSVMNGPEHVLTSFGYFDLGNVFAAKSNMENAMAFYDKVKDVWSVHLTTALRLVIEQGSGEGQAMDIDAVLPYGTPVAFGEENIHDSAKMLRGIVGLQRERFGVVHPSTAKAEYVLGMFLLWNDDTVGACDTLLRALEIMKREYGERHPNTGEVRALMLNFGMQIPEDTSHVLAEEAGTGSAGPPQPSSAQQEADDAADNRQQQQQQENDNDIVGDDEQPERHGFSDAMGEEQQQPPAQHGEEEQQQQQQNARQEEEGEADGGAEGGAPAEELDQEQAAMQQVNEDAETKEGGGAEEEAAAAANEADPAAEDGGNTGAGENEEAAAAEGPSSSTPPQEEGAEGTASPEEGQQEGGAAAATEGADGAEGNNNNENDNEADEGADENNNDAAAPPAEEGAEDNNDG